MSIKVVVSGSFVDVIVTNVLVTEDLQLLYDALDTASRKGPFVVLTDTLNMEAAPRQVIMSFADGLKKMPSLKDVWLGDAVVIRSPITRFALSTLIIVAPLPTEVQVFERREPAERWCAFTLLKAGVRVPPPLKKFAE